MNVGVAHSEVNPNSSWLNSKGTWLTYVIFTLILHFVLLSLPFLSTPVAWTLTNVLHNCVSAHFFFSINIISSLNIPSFFDKLVCILSNAYHKRSAMGDYRSRKS